MKKTSDYRNVWEITSQPEKERIFSKFLKEYGENYTPDDFIRFLKKRYEVSNYMPTYTNWRQGF
ncbi:MAG: hypothetical protein WBW79_04265 [Desulfocapsaceae bacterium]|jgi:hypothetical protein